MHGIFIVFAFLLGLAFGSFANVLIYRVPRGLSLLWPASHCPVCKTPIRWHDNIPLFSYVWLRGRCRFCKARISPRYPLVELLTGLLFLVFAVVDHSWLSFVFHALLGTLVIVLVAIDLEHHRLPDPLTFSVAILGLLWAVVTQTLWTGIQGFLVGGAFGGGLAWLAEKWYGTDEGFGWGDAKYLAAMGTWVGPWAVTVILFGGALLGSIVGLLLGLRRRTLRFGLPFGPFLSVVFLLTILAPQFIIELKSWILR